MLLEFLRHWYEGEPVAETLNDAGRPAQTFWLAGWPEMEGPELREKAAVLLSTEPQGLETRQV